MPVAGPAIDFARHALGGREAKILTPTGLTIPTFGCVSALTPIWRLTTTAWSRSFTCPGGARGCRNCWRASSSRTIRWTASACNALSHRLTYNAVIAGALAAASRRRISNPPQISNLPHKDSKIPALLLSRHVPGRLCPARRDSVLPARAELPVRGSSACGEIRCPGAALPARKHAVS